MDVNPISIILVKSDSKGDRLLFRYPYVLEENRSTVQSTRKNPYSITQIEDVLQNPIPQTQNLGQLSGITDEVLSTLFAVKSELCNKKFELKVNDVRFVGHPTLMKSKSSNDDTISQILVNIVFALNAQSSYSIVKCYYELSKRLGIALLYEENRSGYLSKEMKSMLKIHDEVASVEEQENSNKKMSAFDSILKDVVLAQCLKNIYHDLCTTGVININLNQSVTLSFCLPQKAHQFHKKGFVIEPEAIDKCLQALKPYHGMLLLVDPSELFDCVPPSGAKIILQLIEVYNPLKSLQNMASDADLTIEHVYQIVGHLVYWAKATIIYPLCETNVYVIAPDAPLHVNSILVDKFSKKFPGMSLFEVISDFSLPTSIGHLTTPLQHPSRQGRLAQMVLWLLQHHLVMQLHTYVQFMPEYEETVDHSTTNMSFIQFDESRSFSSEKPGSEPLEVPTSKRNSIIYENISDRPSCSSHKSSSSITQAASLNDESIASVEDEDKIRDLLLTFNDTDRRAILKIPAASNAEDLQLMMRLWQSGYFKGEHHLEEIMYFENLRRSQLLQLLDKFRDVLIIYETEDPAIASLYTQT